MAPHLSVAALGVVACLALLSACDPASSALVEALDQDRDAGAPRRDAEPDAEPDLDPYLCGGAYAWPCAADKYCAFDTGCGTVGNCVPRDSECKTKATVCGCDGVTYESKCAAGAKGWGVDHQGACGATEQQFRCGRFTCDATTSYCLDKNKDYDDAEERYVCFPWPAGCDGCDCTSKLDLACYIGATCSEQNGAARVTCKVVNR